MRMATISASVPLARQRYSSTLGTHAWMSLASFISYSWKSPVTGPECRTASQTFSLTGP